MSFYAFEVGIVANCSERLILEKHPLQIAGKLHICYILNREKYMVD